MSKYIDVRTTSWQAVQPGVPTYLKINDSGDLSIPDTLQGTSVAVEFSATNRVPDAPYEELSPAEIEAGKVSTEQIYRGSLVIEPVLIDYDNAARTHVVFENRGPLQGWDRHVIIWHLPQLATGHSSRIRFLAKNGAYWNERGQELTPVQYSPVYKPATYEWTRHDLVAEFKVRLSGITQL